MVRFSGLISMNRHEYVCSLAWLLIDATTIAPFV